MRPTEALRSAADVAARDSSVCLISREPASELSGRAPSTLADEDWEPTPSDRTEALRFWKDVSGIWPKSWWSPTQQWRDFLLRSYARTKIQELEHELAGLEPAAKKKAMKTRIKLSKIVALIAFVCALAAAAPSRARGQGVTGSPIPNWSAPATWSPHSASRGVSTMGDVTNPLPFIGVTPCRLVDTRGAPGVPIAGGIFAANEARTWTFTGLCGLPLSAAAVSLNITVTNTGANPFGFVKVWPGGGTEPTVSTLNWSAGGVTESNAAIVPLGTGVNAGKINLRSGNAGSDVIVDVNGYYASTTTTNRLGSGEFFGIFGTRGGGGVIHGGNNSVSGNSAGILGVDPASVTSSVFFFPAGVRGEGNSIGVLGVSSTVGVAGVFLDGGGAVVAQGVLASNGAGSVAGVWGLSNVITADSAGVLGVDGTGFSNVEGRASAGLRGESAASFGVLGLSGYIGVVGSLYDSTGATLIAEGFLGSNFGVAPGPFGPPWGVFASGNLGASGAKHFVEPHPADPTRVILYSSLEGREVGTYFRGTAHTVKGEAVIEVPEDFRIVTDEEGLTIQLTPVGPLTMMSVESEDLGRIVVRSSKDVKFHYLVQGVRRAFKDFEPVARGMEFAPRSTEDRMPGYLTEEAKRRLIANGTYNGDGTVNMVTAERAGWTRIWREREERDRTAAAANATARAAGLSERK